MSVGLKLDLSGDVALQTRLKALSNFRLDDLMGYVADEVENQTRRRIQEEKQSPDGTEWEEWSESYEDSRHDGQSLLEGEGHLVDSITSAITASGAEVGSNLVYAAVHQHGIDDPAQSYKRKGKTYTRHMHIPARPYLGINEENELDIRSVIEDWFALKVAS